MKGIRGVFAMTLGLEAIVVLLALLVLPKFGDGATPLGVGVIAGIAVLMFVAAGMQRRSYGLSFALVLQVAVIAAGFVFVPALGVTGVIFGFVWGTLLYLRREVATRMGRGELPSQQAQDS
jgi:FtsH-binding integral membrane protein